MAKGPFQKSFEALRQLDRDEAAAESRDSARIFQLAAYDPQAAERMWNQRFPNEPATFLGGKKFRYFQTRNGVFALDPKNPINLIRLEQQGPMGGMGQAGGMDEAGGAEQSATRGLGAEMARELVARGINPANTTLQQRRDARLALDVGEAKRAAKDKAEKILDELKNASDVGGTGLRSQAEILEEIKKNPDTRSAITTVMDEGLLNDEQESLFWKLYRRGNEAVSRAWGLLGKSEEETLEVDELIEGLTIGELHERFTPERVRAILAKQAKKAGQPRESSVVRPKTEQENKTKGSKEFRSLTEDLFGE